ncbi:MAG: toprim domain-containing protein [Pseudomonadota bacterium]|nr:toprim domain-containing protein [Pseudomonadota bacterium]
MATSKFFPNPGSPKSAIEYLLDEKHQPEVMRGNPQSFLDLANSLEFKNQYTSGVIRTTETMNDEQMNFIMDKYTQFLTAGLNQPPEVLFVKHYEHGETELHFVIPNVDLESGRAFQPYAHSRDLKRRDALDNIINAKFDFHDPDDPANQRFTASDKDYLRTSKDRKGLAEVVDKAISDSMVSTIQNGGIYDRKAVVSDLKSLGFEVKERGKSISIKNDAMAKPMRLKGSFYEPTARFNETSFGAIQEASEQYRASRSERFKANVSEYKQLTQDRIGQVESRYSHSWKNAEKSIMADASRAVERQSSPSTNAVLVDHSDSRQGKRTLSSSDRDRQLQPSQQAESTESPKRPVSDNAQGHETRLQLRTGLQDKVIPCYYKDREIGQVVDKGSKLVAQGFKSQKATAYNLLEQAKNKGWTSVQTDSKDPDFLRHLHEQSKYKGIELTPKNQTQRKILEEIQKDDRTRKDALRAVEEIGKRTADFERRKSNFTQESESYKQTSGKFNTAIGERAMRRDQELERFKTDINLVDYAQSLGFEVVKKESTKKSIKLKNGSDTLIISTDTDGHGIYFNAQSNKSGSIIDLVQEFKNLNLGQVRKELRPFIGRDANARIEQDHYTPKPLKSTKDQVLVANEFAKTEPLLTHPYLSERGITESTQSNPKFQGKFRIDDRQNVIFPHFKGGEVVGFEKKNTDFTGFSSGGEKSVWYSNGLMQADKVVIVESAIDAMSFEQLHGKGKNYGYISIGGQPRDEQLQVLAKLDPSKLILGLDNDEGGESIKTQIEAVTGTLKEVKPKSKDFNQDLSITSLDFSEQRARIREERQNQSSSYGQTM